MTLNRVEGLGGCLLAGQPNSVALHGDGPNAPAIARAVLEASGVKSASLTVLETA